MDEAEKYEKRYKAVLRKAYGGALLKLSALEDWGTAKGLSFSFVRTFPYEGEGAPPPIQSHFIDLRLIGPGVASVFKKNASDAAIQGYAERMGESGPNREAAWIAMAAEIDYRILCAVFDGELTLYDSACFPIDVSGERRKYEAQPESYLTEDSRSASELEARDLSLIDLTADEWNRLSRKEREGALRSIAATKELSEKIARQADERRALGRYTLSEAAKAIAATGERFDAVQAKLCAAAERGELSVHAPGERARYEYSNGRQVRPFYEETYASDLNAWLETNEPRIEFRFATPAIVAGNAKPTVHTATAETEPTRLVIGSNSKASINAYVDRRSREIFSAGQATDKGPIAEIIAKELEAWGHASQSGKYLSAATIEKAIPAGLTGGRAKNGRKK